MTEDDGEVALGDQGLQPRQLAAEIDFAEFGQDLQLVLVFGGEIVEGVVEVLQPALHRDPEPVGLLGDGDVERVDFGHFLGHFAGDFRIAQFIGH